MTAEVLPVAPPSVVGVDARGILSLVDALDADPAITPHGLVVLRDGYRIAQGSWAPFTPERVQLVYSISKSFTTTAVGLARHEGLIDLDATVLSYFPELDADITDPRSRSMKVRHVAAMASGHASETIDLAAAQDPTDLVRGFLLLPPDAEPGTLFAYNQPCTYALAAIVQRASGQTLVDYLRPRLFDPLGIDDVAWIEAPAGRNLGFSGIHVTTDAIARLGELYRRGGMWGDRRVLDEDWVALATQRHIATPTPPGGPDWGQGYGSQFWMSQHGYRGDGAFGQFCVVVPEHGLVVAITSETAEMQHVLDAIWTHLLPAIGTGTGAVTDADAELEVRLAGLRLPATTGDADPASPETWASRTFAATGSAPVTSVRVADGWRLELTDDGGVVDVPFAAGEWVVGESGAPTAASGGWDGDVLTVDIRFLEAPHTLRVTCDGVSGAARTSWRTHPLHDARPSALHRP